MPRFHVPLVGSTRSPATNRTCGFPASGVPTAVAYRHTPLRLHLKAKLVPGSPRLSLEVIGLRHSPDLCPLPKRVRSQAPFLPACRAGLGAGRRRHYPASMPLTRQAGLFVGPGHRYESPFSNSFKIASKGGRAPTRGAPTTMTILNRWICRKPNRC